MNALEPVFAWLLTATLRASILAVVILGIQFVLRHKLPAAWRHALWLPMLAVLVLPVLPEAPFALLPPKVESSPLAYLTQEVTQESIPTTFDFTASQMVFASPTVTTAPSVVEKRNVFPLIWLVGACVVLAAGAVGYIRNMRHIRLNATAPDRALQAAIDEAANKVGLNRAPRTLISPAVASPAVTGLVRPILLLPARFPEGFSAMESRLVLLHEFIHLKRLDLPVNWLLCVLQAMHWFNPIVWFAFARMRADREAACDARVLSLEATDRRSEYGGALLKLQCMTPSSFISLGFVGIFERGSEIKSRIKGIASHHPARLTWKAAGGAIFALLILFGVTQGQEPESSSDGQESRVEAAAEATEAGSGQDRIPKQLDSIISYFELNNATVEEAFQLLERQTQGVKFVLQLPDSAEVGWSVMNGTQIRRHTMAFENLRLSQIVQAICGRSNLRYTMDEDSVILLPGDKENGDLSVPVPKNSDPQELIMQKLDSIIVPSINFNDATVEEAVQFLNQRSQALDTSEADPAKKGVYFMLLSPDAIAGEPVELSKITLQLQDMPLSGVLQHICDAANLRHIVSHKGVILHPRGKLPPKYSPEQELLQQKMKSLIIPSINFNNATVEEAVQFLNQRSQALDTSEADPAKKGVYFRLLRTGAFAGEPVELPKITLQLQDMPLSGVLQHICDAARLHYTVSNRAVVLYPKAKRSVNSGAPKNSPEQELLQQKMKSLIIPSINFNDATVEEAVQFLNQRSQALDTSEADPAKRGVYFKLLSPGAIAGEPVELSKITLQLQDMPLSGVLQHICDAANLYYSVSDKVVILFPGAKRTVNVGAPKTSSAQESTPSNPVFVEAKEMGKTYESLDELDKELSEQGYFRQGNFAKEWPAKVIRVQTATDGISFQFAGSGIHSYPGYDGYEFKVVILLSDRGNETAAVYRSKEHTPKPAQVLLQQKINSLIIPSINFNNATVEEAIQFLRQRTQELDTSEPDPAKRGVNFVLPKIPDAIAGEVPKITLQLRNIPLSDALQHICDAAYFHYTVNNNAVIIYPILQHFQREKGREAE